MRSGKWGLGSQRWIQGRLLLGPAEGCFGAAWSGYLRQTGVDWQRLLVVGAVDTTGSRSRRERRRYRYGIWYKFACDTQVQSHLVVTKAKNSGFLGSFRSLQRGFGRNSL